MKLFKKKSIIKLLDDTYLQSFQKLIKTIESSRIELEKNRIRL